MPSEASRRLRKRLAKPFNKLSASEQDTRKEILSEEIGKMKNKNKGKSQPKKNKGLLSKLKDTTGGEAARIGN